MEDVYWSEEGVLSLQFSFAAIALLAALALGRAAWLRRGEETVLPPAPPVTPWARRTPSSSATLSRCDTDTLRWLDCVHRIPSRSQYSQNRPRMSAERFEKK